MLTLTDSSSTEIVAGSSISPCFCIISFSMFSLSTSFLASSGAYSVDIAHTYEIRFTQDHMELHEKKSIPVNYLI